MPWLLVARIENSSAPTLCQTCDTKSPENILQNDLGRYDPTRWRLGRYDAACGRVLEFPDVPDVAPGRGFWLIAREGGNFGASGYSVQPNITWNGTSYYRLAVDSGWNQLANPFAFDISYRELLFVHNGTVLSHDPEIIDDIAYAYNGQGFVAKDILLAWEGSCSPGRAFSCLSKSRMWWYCFRIERRSLKSKHRLWPKRQVTPRLPTIGSLS